jgi:hypothetical protein
MNIKIPDLNQIPPQSDIEVQPKTQGRIKQQADYNFRSQPYTQMDTVNSNLILPECRSTNPFCE